MPFRNLFIVLGLVFSCLIGVHVFFSYRDTGILSYPLDDAFIHMAISRNLVEHGVWGITPFEFSSTSSSLLYTLILALGFMVAGIKVWLPLLINYLIGLVILFFTTRISQNYLTWKQSFTWHLLFIFLVPLAGMAVLGMEHTLQILLCLLFVYQTWKLWNGNNVSAISYFIMALLAVATRYESAFLVGLTAAAWLFVFGNFKRAVYLLIAIAVPIIAFGLFSLSKGGFFFPNSLLAKSNFINGSLPAFFSVLSAKFLATGLIYSLILLPFVYFLLFPITGWKDLENQPKHLLMLLLAATSLAHFVLASFGWLFRYEAYLVALLFLTIMITWKDWFEWISQRTFFNKRVIVLISALMLFPVLSRVMMISHTKRAVKNIADQQVQMAKFVHDHFPAYGIAMNDIGALGFYNEDIRIFDMEGLGTAEVIRQKKQFDSSFLIKYVAEHDIKIGIFYPHLYKNKIPSSWQQAGTWELTDNFVTGGSVVGFYAIDPAEKAKLIQALKQHAARLPANVISKINAE
jgi:hypothetical protein